jgi:hypothetical protein
VDSRLEAPVEPRSEAPVEPRSERFVGFWFLFGSQFPLSVLSTISSRVALLNLSVPLEDNPPALGVQYFTVCHRSVTVTLPVRPCGHDWV